MGTMAGQHRALLDNGTLDRAGRGGPTVGVGRLAINTLVTDRRKGEQNEY